MRLAVRGVAVRKKHMGGGYLVKKRETAVLFMRLYVCDSSSTSTSNCRLTARQKSSLAKCRLTTMATMARSSSPERSSEAAPSQETAKGTRSSATAARHCGTSMRLGTHTTARRPCVAMRWHAVSVFPKPQARCSVTYTARTAASNWSRAASTSSTTMRWFGVQRGQRCVRPPARRACARSRAVFGKATPRVRTRRSAKRPTGITKRNADPGKTSTNSPLSRNIHSGRPRPASFFKYPYSLSSTCTPPNIFQPLYGKLL
ncbi:PP41 [Orf virus]|uniref:PP41 n=1 Tax=Orf virus TaxID=10258 RepID=F1AXC1_ORFV|nr:PP41 [Orf virus]